ncbi:hypothetical protein J4476_06065 [Candidatus Woesearchaeota archaeon]|nr:hypothetical protein [Candidatus Woesearchaeota archaeon]HIH25562.1 hypothetical protein [Nanoarchaeota archaeon]
MPQIQLKKQSSEHSPTLNTILMVEKVLEKDKDLLSVAEIKRRLPKKIMHKTLLQVLDYLQNSGKILIGTKGVLWVYTDSKELEAKMKKGLQV